MAKHIHIHVGKAKAQDTSVELALATKEVRKLQQAGVVAHYVVVAKVMNMLIGQGFGRDYSQKVAEEAMDLMAYDSKDAVYNLRETNGTSWGTYSASSSAEAKELLKRDIKKDPSKFMGVKFLTNGDPDLSQVRSILHPQDAERFGLKEVTRAEFDKKTRSGEWEAMQDITSSGRVEVRNTSTNKRFQVYVKEASQDASNHLGEKEYYTFRRWKEAVKAAYPNARFEGDQDMCNAVPGGEWDGEKGCVYANKTKDVSYNQNLVIQLPNRIQGLVSRIDSYSEIRSKLSNSFGKATTLANAAKRLSEKDFEANKSILADTKELFDVVLEAERILR